MNEKALNIRQICFLFAAVLPVTRMLVYPATLSFQAKNDLVLSAFISFAAEFAVIALLLWLAKKPISLSLNCCKTRSEIFSPALYISFFPFIFSFPPCFPFSNSADSFCRFFMRTYHRF